MSFFDLASTDFKADSLTASIFKLLIALALSGALTVLIVKLKSKIAKVSAIVITVIFVVFCFQSSVSANSDLEARVSANAKTLEEYALSEYGVELTVTEINASPKTGSLTEYYHSRKGVKKIPASGLNVATAVDPETRTAYSFDANKDHEIVLLKNGEPVLPVKKEMSRESE